jgi:hypothetical protein
VNVLAVVGDFFPDYLRLRPIRVHSLDRVGQNERAESALLFLRQRESQRMFQVVPHRLGVYLHDDLSYGDPALQVHALHLEVDNHCGRVVDDIADNPIGLSAEFLAVPVDLKQRLCHRIRLGRLLCSRQRPLIGRGHLLFTGCRNRSLPLTRYGHDLGRKDNVP